MGDANSVDQILADREIKKIMLKCDDEKKEQIKKAAKFLIDNRQDLEILGSFVEGLRKTARAVSTGKLKIFVSFKQSDETAVKAHDVLREELLAYSAEKIEVLSAPEYKIGFPWTQAIRSQINEANWFILLLPDPSLDWDWVLFETGMFRARMRPGDRLVCLHHPGTKPPTQIYDFQAVKSQKKAVHKLLDKAVTSDHKEVHKLLRELFVEPNAVPGMPPINPNAKGKLKKAAKAIGQAISPPEEKIERNRYAAMVRIYLSDPKSLFSVREKLSDDKIQNLKNAYEEIREAGSDEEQERAISNALVQENKKILDNATFKPLPDDPKRARIGANDRALQIFGKEKVPPTFGGLTKNVTKHWKAQQWLGELGFAIKDVVTNNPPAPIKATFTAVGTKSPIRTILYAVDRPLDRIDDVTTPDAFMIVFVPDIGASDIEEHGPSKDYVDIAKSIRLAYRFRWEVVEPFKKMTRDDFVAFEDAFHRVMGESEYRNHIELEKLADHFDNAEDSLRVRELYLDFRTTLFELQTLLEKKDAATIQTTLREFASRNQEYLMLATRLFASMNEREFEGLLK